MSPLDTHALPWPVLLVVLFLCERPRLVRNGPAFADADRSGHRAGGAQGQRRTQCTENSYRPPGPLGGVTTFGVVGSGPRPAAKLASSLRVPASTPSIPKFPSWHRGSR